MLEKNEMIFGVRAVIEAIQAGREIDKVLVKKDIQSELSKELFACLKNTLIPVQRVPVERINRITRKNHQGVVAFNLLCHLPETENLVPSCLKKEKHPYSSCWMELPMYVTSEPLPVPANVPVQMPLLFPRKTVSVSMLTQ